MVNGSASGILAIKMQRQSKADFLGSLQTLQLRRLGKKYLLQYLNTANNSALDEAAESLNETTPPTQIVTI